jgi:hypothetical protein
MKIPRDYSKQFIGAALSGNLDNMKWLKDQGRPWT